MSAPARPIVSVLCPPLAGGASTAAGEHLGPEPAAALGMALLLDGVDALVGAPADLQACAAGAADLALLRALLPPGVAAATPPPGARRGRALAVARAGARRAPRIWHLAHRLADWHTPPESANQAFRAAI